MPGAQKRGSEPRQNEMGAMVDGGGRAQQAATATCWAPGLGPPVTRAPFDSGHLRLGPPATRTPITT